MSHQDPYVSTTTMDDLKSSVHAPWQPPASEDTADQDAALAAIRDDARRIGRLLVRIPFLDMMFFFVRVFFALFFATLVYLFLWWLLIAASAGAGFSLLHVLARLMQLPGY